MTRLIVALTVLAALLGVSRISFLVNSVENDPAHIVRPIN